MPSIWDKRGYWSIWRIKKKTDSVLNIFLGKIFIVFADLNCFIVWALSVKREKWSLHFCSCYWKLSGAETNKMPVKYDKNVLYNCALVHFWTPNDNIHLNRISITFLTKWNRKKQLSITDHRETNLLISIKFRHL